MRAEPWSISTKKRRHDRLLDLWIGQVQWYSNYVDVTAGKAENELLDRFRDVVDTRAPLADDQSPRYVEGADDIIASVQGRFLVESVTRDPEWADDFDAEPDRPSAWHAADVLAAGLEATRPLFSAAMSAPRGYVWSVGADLMMAWLYSISALPGSGGLVVPDPSDPFGIFAYRWFAYDDYLTPVDGSMWDFVAEPGPGTNPLQMDFQFVGGPVGAYLAERAERWMVEAADTAMRLAGTPIPIENL